MSIKSVAYLIQKQAKAKNIDISRSQCYELLAASAKYQSYAALDIGLIPGEPSCDVNSIKMRCRQLGISEDVQISQIIIQSLQDKNLCWMPLPLSPVAKYFTECIDIRRYNVPDEYDYSCVPLCVIDSVFSIGIRYSNVTKIVDRVCRKMNITKAYENPGKSQITTSWFLEHINGQTPEQLADNFFESRHRTSPANGILKAEAVVRFIRVLKEFGVERLEDVNKIINSYEFEQAIRAIPGQKSGICLKYFLMLAGNTELIKPDRMILRFLESALQREVSAEESVVLIRQACDELKHGYNFIITPKIMDNLIWQYQRTL
jgi:hypothetical protein